MRFFASAVAAALLFLLFASPALAQGGPVQDLECELDPLSLETQVTWINGDIYGNINVFVDGVLIETLLGIEESYVVPPPGALPELPPFPGPDQEICIEPTDVTGAPLPQECCLVDLPPPPVDNLQCQFRFVDADPPMLAELSFDVPVDDLDEILIFQNGDLVDTLLAPTQGLHELELPIPPDSIQLFEIQTVYPNPLLGPPTPCPLLAPPLPLPPQGLLCPPPSLQGLDLHVQWLLGSPNYDGLEVHIDQALHSSLAPDATEVFLTENDAPAGALIEIRPLVGDLLMRGPTCVADYQIPPSCAGGTVTGRLTGTGAVDLFIEASGTVESVEVFRNGLSLDSGLDAYIAVYSDDAPEPGFNSYKVVWECTGGGSFFDTVTVYFPRPDETPFIRGDCNGDGFFDLGDVFGILTYLFLPIPYTPPCLDACDFNNDGEITMLDALDLLDYLYRGGPAPELPFPDCGLDTLDSLGCLSFDGCDPLGPFWDVGWSHTQTDVFSGGEQEPPHDSVVPELAGIAVLCSHLSRPDGGVMVHSGEFVHTPVLPNGTIPGRGNMDLNIPLIYRSQIDLRSCVGAGWNLWPLTEALVELPGGGFRRFDARNARIDDFDADGESLGLFQSLHVETDPVGVETVIVTHRNGDRDVYFGFNNECTDGKLSHCQDRYGNRIDVVYDDQCRVSSVVDPMGREMTYSYYDDGMLHQITDFSSATSPRTTTFGYDQNFNLVSLTTPSVSTDFNDFPQGKTYLYSYSSGFDDARLNQNLLSITDPKGQVYMQCVYGDDPTATDYDRVTQMCVGTAAHSTTTDTGATVPGGGGCYLFEYGDVLTPGGEPLRTCTVTDPNGNEKELDFDASLRRIEERCFTNRNINPNDASVYTTSFEYDAESRLVQWTSPMGSSIELTYDVSSPNRRSQANLLSIVRNPDVVRVGSQLQLETTYTYEPIYNMVRTITTPRGNDSNWIPTTSVDQVVRVDLNLDGDDDDPLDGENDERLRFTRVYLYDYQEGTAQEILDLADAVGVELDLDGSGPLTELDYADALSLDEDTNGDGESSTSGRPTQVHFPYLHHGDGTSSAVVRTYTYNRFGQMTSRCDPEGNLTCYYYYPEDDPDGDGVSVVIDGVDADDVTGGYVRLIVEDDDPADAASPPAPRPDQPISNSGTARRTRTAEFVQRSSRFEYDAVGNVVSVVDARGVRSDFLVNELNQVQEIRLASEVDVTTPDPSEPLNQTDFDFVRRFHYDANDNVVRMQVEDRGDTSDVGGDNGAIPFVDTVYDYDILDQCVRVTREVSDDEDLTTEFRYDSNGNRVLVVQPEGNAVTVVYDERDLPFAETHGALTIPPVIRIGTGDALVFPGRGGLPSRRCYTYDGNRNAVEVCDADDSDGSAANNGLFGGDRTRCYYDGYDRLVSHVDSVGNQTVYQLDPDSNSVRVLTVGSSEGPTPTDDGAVAEPIFDVDLLQDNLVSSNLLYSTESHHDEFGNCFRSDTVLFVNSTPTVRTPDVQDGALDLGKDSLITGDDRGLDEYPQLTVEGRVNREYLYDRNGHILERAEDDGDVTLCEYDGLDRMVRCEDPEGNVRELAYDDNHNVIEVRATEVPQLATLSEEVFLYTCYYDSLNRCVQTVNNVGETSYYRYDSRSNLVAETDAAGPLSTSSFSRRVFAEPPGTTTTINDFGNVTRYTYDGMCRMTRSTRYLTTSGEGDGVSIVVTEEGVPSATLEPQVDTGQGNGDGLVRVGHVYDGNSNRIATVDDNGNVTARLYDNQDRRIIVFTGLEMTTTPYTGLLLAGRPVPAVTQLTTSAPFVFPPDLIDPQIESLHDRVVALIDDFPAIADVTGPPTSRVYGYDPDDNVRMYLDQNGSEIRCDYDGLSRVTATRVFRAGQQDSFFGDPLFAPSPFWGGGGGGGALILVAGSNARDYEYDGLSRPVRLSDNNDPGDPSDDSVLLRAYDSLSRMVEESQQVGAGDACVVSSSWRAESLRGSCQYPDGRDLHFTYDGLDRLQTITNRTDSDPLADYTYVGPGSSTASMLLPAVQGARSPRDAHGEFWFTDLRPGYHGGGGAGRLALYAYPEPDVEGSSVDASGALTGFDGARRITALSYRDSAGTDLLGNEYSYDRRDNILSETKTHDVDNSRSVVGIDSMSRVTEWGAGDDPTLPTFLSTLLSLDGLGNWLDFDGETRNHDNFNALADRSDPTGATTTYFYDDNGNLTDNGRHQYLWDFRNRLVQVLDPVLRTTVARYAYDAVDRRVRKTIPGAVGASDTVEQYCYDGIHVIEERDDTDTPVRQYVYGARVDEPVVMDIDDDSDGVTDDPIADTRYYYCHDGVVRSVIGLLDRDGDLVESYQYDLYGRPTRIEAGLDGVLDFSGDTYTDGVGSAVGNPYLFTGRRYDAETGLYYYRQRYYDASDGRFLSRDPMLSTSGVPDLYEYANGNPMRHSDPQGLAVYLKYDGVKGEAMDRKPKSSSKGKVFPKVEIHVTAPEFCGKGKKKGNIEYSWKVEEGCKGPSSGNGYRWKVEEGVKSHHGDEAGTMKSWKVAELDGKGSAADDKHEKWIDVLSIDWGLHKPGGGKTGQSRRRGDVILDDISCVKELDKASPKLAESVCKGKVFPKVDIHLTASYTDAGRVTYYAYELKNVMITSYNVSGSGQGSDVPLEDFSLNFEEIKVTYTENDSKGKKKGNIEYGWKVQEGTK